MFGQRPAMLLDQRRESAIEEEHPVFGMIDDVNQLLEMQARIAGMDDQAAARHRIINLNVTVIVPGEGADRGARRQSQVGEGVGESFDARRALRKAVAKHRSVGFARNDLRARRVAPRHARGSRRSAAADPS